MIQTALCDFSIAKAVFLHQTTIDTFFLLTLRLMYRINLKSIYGEHHYFF